MDTVMLSPPGGKSIQLNPPNRQFINELLTMPKHPEIEVRLTGTDGNAFAVLGHVSKALRRGGVDRDQINAFLEEATDGDYNHLLRTCMRWVHTF